MGWIERLRPRGFEAVLTVESTGLPWSRRTLVTHLPVHPGLLPQSGHFAHAVQRPNELLP